MRHEIQNRAAQGDIIIRRVESLPEGAVKRAGKDAGIVAHSETGHHHVALGCDVYDVPGDGMTCYLVSEGEIDIEHHRPWDTHEPLRLLGQGGLNTWMVRRQREHTPEGWRRVED